MKENKTLITAGAVLAVVVVGYALWLSYANKKVREVVDTSLERLEQRLEAKGKEVTITYDDVKVHSLSLRPSASVYKLHIKMEDKLRDREMHLMLPEVVYTPKTFNMRSYKLELIDSATLIASEKGEQESTLVDFSAAPALHVNEKGNGDLHYAMNVPAHIALTSMSGQEDAASPDKTDITFAALPQVEWMVSREGISMGQKAIFPQTTLTHGGETLAQVDGVRVETAHSNEGNGIHSYAMVARLDNLTFSLPELEVLNPVSLINDVTFTGPAVVPGDTAPVSAPQHFKLNNIAWTSGLVSVFANGDVHFEPEKERMPHGKIALRFDDVDTFLEYAKAQRPKAEAYLLKVRSALEQLSGAKLEEGGSVTINLEREPNGRLHIGQLTLEESLGLFIEMAMELPDLSAPRKTVDAPAETGDEDSEQFDVYGESDGEADASGDVVEEETVDTEATEEAAPVAPVASDEAKPAEIRTGKDALSVEIRDMHDADASGAEAEAKAQEATETEQPEANSTFVPTAE